MTNHLGEKIATHARGDAHAADIVEGRYPFATAVADRARTVAMHDAMLLSAWRRDHDELTVAECLIRGWWEQ